MAKRGRKPKPVVLDDEDRAALEALVARPSAPHRDVVRARIVLLAADGVPDSEIMAATGMSSSTVTKWKARYRQLGFAGLTDAPRSGRPRTISDDLVRQVVDLTLQTAPKGATHWSTRRLAQKVGLGQSTISRIWQAFRLQPHRRETFELSKDPYFVDKVRDVVGLYVDPPANAVVFSVDEKTQIQALERTQTIIPLGPTKPMAFSPKYRRHGTVDLFAALDVATGKVLAKTYDQHKSAELIDFFQHIDDTVDSDLDIHIIMDNASTHRSAETLEWVARHPRFHLHYTPTYASWLNQVEALFSLLTERQLKHGVHTSVEQLVASIMEFIDARNDDPKPFKWTKTADQILERVARFCAGLLERHGETSHTGVPADPGPAN
jgi:transposase